MSDRQNEERRAREKREGARSETEIEPRIDNTHTQTDNLACMLILTK